MKKISMKAITLLLVAGFTLPGCQAVKNLNQTQGGAIIGTLGGAALGSIIGGKDNRALGAILGAAVGGVAGGVIGKKMDKQAEKIETTLPGAEVRREGEGIQVILDEKSGGGVKFPVNQSTITSLSAKSLNKLITVFKEFPDTNILVIGHTDSSGSDQLNLNLSKKRADSVISYLTSHGISSSRLKSQGLGEAQPKFSNDTESGKAQNRRVEFAITANNKMIRDAESESSKQ
jgi:outer membrane protein OmpA-like peptidoglycan-associated protein